MKVLITGANGLLGIKVVKELQQNGYDVIPTHHSKPLHSGSLKLDVTENEAVDKLIRRIRPDIVIHAAAETNVDLCEKEPVHAYKVNVNATRNIAISSQKAKAKLIYISTDYVFDGNKGYYAEEDETNPINFYGLTKLKGEEEVRKHCSNYLILRSSVNFGWHPYKQSFATWVITSLEHGETISVVTNHYNTPTLTNNLAQVIKEAMEKDLVGLYHASGAERINRYKFAIKIAHKFNLPEEIIKPIKMKDLKSLGIWIANRPPDSSLNTFKLQNKKATRLMTVDEALEAMRREEIIL